MNIQDFLKNVKTIAVLGVSDDPKKYGNKVFFDLLNSKYTVFPVHPSAGEIAGIKRYAKLSDIKEKIDLVNLVISPKYALPVLEEMKKLNIDKVWFQPGSESEELIQYCKDNNIKYLHSVCLMLNK